MSKEQIEEMAKVIKFCKSTSMDACHKMADCEHCVAAQIFNAGYRKQSEWISVDERLPSEKERRDKYGELVPFLVVEEDTTQPFRAFYDGSNWGDGMFKINVTHWMPLPEPPRMRKEDEEK